MKIRVAINQLMLDQGGFEINFKIMERTIERNASNGAKLSVFPEDFLYGILRDEADLRRAASHFDEWVVKLSELAKLYQIDIVPGTMPRVENRVIVNSSIYIDKAGRTLGEYSKNNLWLSERDELSPALSLPEVFDTQLGRTAMLICWDLFDHTLFEEVVRQGAEWIIVPAFWSNNQSTDLRQIRGIVRKRYPGYSDSKVLDVLIRARVAEYNIGVIFCNFAGTHECTSIHGQSKIISANRSQAVSPYLINYGRLANRKEKTLLVEIPNINEDIANNEIHYGRRTDVVSAYPWGNSPNTFYKL